MRYTFIEPERPQGPSLADQLRASLAITPPADNIELAGVISDLTVAIDDAAGAVLDAEDDRTAAPALATIKRSASVLLATIAAYEEART